MMKFERAKAKYEALKLPSDLIVVRISKRIYRLARITNDGSGYTNWAGEDIGITGIREAECFSENLSWGQLTTKLWEIAKDEGDQVTIEI